MRRNIFASLLFLCAGAWSVAFAQQSSPLINSVSPVAARAGDQIAISGTGFGASQGNGNVWLGSTYGVVVSWSDSQVVAAVATGSKSGVAQILQGSVWSNAADFIVITPNITGVSPTTATAGTQITITGTGFGGSQGNGNVWLGSTYGVVVGWSDTQIVANVASGSKSGVAQVLQGGVWSNSVNLAVSTPNITSVAPTTAIAGTQITIAGTGFGASQGSGNVWLGSTYGLVVSWTDTQIVANVASGSKTGVAQVLQGGVWSNSVNLAVSTPNITSVAPTTAIAGTQITIVGTGFGTSQGSGNVWLGSTYGVVASWSDTQIVANVASGSKTGVAQVLQGGVWSNTVNLTVTTPNITGVTPTTAIAGTQITIAGTGFGASQGSGNVWLGSTYGVVVSWGDMQVVANVASGSNTGVAQVLQGGVWSNSIAFTVSSSSPAPLISGISPSAGGIGAAVTIAGSNFGGAQGQSSVSFNGIVAIIAGWSDTSIAAKVPGGLNPGTATVKVNVNQLASNGVQFTVTQPLFLTPSQSTMLVGQTRTMQLLDENGALINNPAWTFDNGSIAEILPPVNAGDTTLLQADAAGTTNVTAAYGVRTGTSKITVLPAGATIPIGSVQWEVPSLGPGRIGKTVQSLRVDDNTPDLYAEDDGAFGGNGAIRALNADGSQKWIWRPAGTDNSPFIAAADDLGGVVYFATMDAPNQFDSFCYFGRLDENGNEAWQYQETNCREDYAIHPDGTIFLVEPAFQNTNADFITALDPTTGQIKFTIPAPGDVFTRGAMSISSEGSVYLPFSTDVGVQLMVIQSDGSSSTQQLDSSPAEGLGRAIPDGQGGALVTASFPPALYHTSTSGTAKFNLPVTPPQIFDPFLDDGSVLVGEDGTAYLVGSSDPEGPVDTQLAIDASSGAVKWTVVPGGTPSPSAVTSNGSLAFQYFQGGSQHLAFANSTGQVSPLFANPVDGSDSSPANASNPNYWTLGTWHTSLTSGGLGAITGINTGLSGSEYTQDNGNRQKQHAAQNLVTATFMPRLPGQPGTHPWGVEAEAKANILGQLKTVAKSSPFYSVSPQQPPTATTDAFITTNGVQPMDLLGFIGDSDLVHCANGPNCFFSDGLVFTDRYLIRTPNCDNQLLGLCYYLDTTGPSNPPPCQPGQQLVADGNCYYNVLPPCQEGAAQLGSYCFRFLTLANGLSARLADVLLTSSKVVFIASCEITDVFTGWWEMNLNAVPGGRALIVPDLATMATINANNGTPPQNQGLVDLVQGAVAYEAFVKAFGAAKSAEDAKSAANQAIANLYPSLIPTYLAPPQGQGQLPQVVYKVVGNPKVCVNCKVNP